MLKISGAEKPFETLCPTPPDNGTEDGAGGGNDERWDYETWEVDHYLQYKLETPLFHFMNFRARSQILLLKSTEMVGLSDGLVSPTPKLIDVLKVPAPVWA